MRLVAVWDIDGTLANHKHRASLLQKRCSVCLHEPMPVGHHEPCPTCGSTSSTTTQESWDAFLDIDLMEQDTVIAEGIELLQKLRNQGAEIHFITGRLRSTTSEVTENWLLLKCNRTDSELLFMREDEDEGLPASVYKERAFKRLVDQIGSDGIFLFFEDDPHVFPVYDKYGIVVRCPQGLKHFMPLALYLWNKQEASNVA